MIRRINKPIYRTTIEPVSLESVCQDTTLLRLCPQCVCNLELAILTGGCISQDIKNIWGQDVPGR